MKWLNDYGMRFVVVGIVAALMLGSGHAKADFIFGEPVNLGPPVNSVGKEVAPSVSADALELYWHSNGEIWSTARITTADSWGTPVNLGPPVSSSSTEYNPSISADGLELYFSSDRPGGFGSQDIYVATRVTRESEWDEVVNLGSVINSETNDGAPSVSADGLELYFQSYNRTGGYGDFDLWVATRATRDEPWGVPVPLPSPLNTSYRDAQPNISDDRLALFFSSDRSGGEGGRDIWMAIRSTKEDPWGTPLNIGPKVNSTFRETNPDFRADGLELYFSSQERPGGMGDHDIWRTPIIPIVDLNGDGIVDSADMCIMVDNWGTDEPLCDIGPMPWGDGIVDVQDLIVLAEHLFEEIPPAELVE